MRDVTDKVTGELDIEIKRGRGRPRKEGALTNAQRQAAFRARRRSESVTVTKSGVAPVDAYDEFAASEVQRLVDANQDLHAELVEARRAVETWQGIANDLRHQLCQAEMERDAVIGWGVSRDEGKLQAALKARRVSVKKAALAEVVAPAKAVTSKRVTKKVDS